MHEDVALVESLDSEIDFIRRQFNGVWCQPLANLLDASDP